MSARPLVLHHQVREFRGPRLQYPALTRKLHGWELLHLRQHVEVLRQALDQAERERDEALARSSWAEENAERWRDDWLQTVNAAGMTPGLTKEGYAVAIPAGASQ